MGKFTDFAASQAANSPMSGRFARLGAGEGDVQNLNTSLPMVTVPAHGGLPGTDVPFTPEQQVPLLPPRKPIRHTFVQKVEEATGRIGEAFIEPWQRPVPSFIQEQLQSTSPIAVTSGLLWNAGDQSLRLLQAATDAIFQTGAEAVSAISGKDPTDTAAALKEYASASPMVGELAAAGAIPRVPKVPTARVVPAEIPPNPLATVYGLEDVLNGKLRADVELDRQARASLNILTPDKSNLDSVVDNYKFWLDQVDPGHVLYPSTDGAVGEGIIGFRTKDGSDFVAAGRGTRRASYAGTPIEDYPTITTSDGTVLKGKPGQHHADLIRQVEDHYKLHEPGISPEEYIKRKRFVNEDMGRLEAYNEYRQPGPSDLTVYVPTAKAAALQKAQQVQMERGNAAGLHWDNQSGKLYFSIIGKDGKVIGEPRRVQTAAAPQRGRVPVEIRTDVNGSQTAQMQDEITQIHQNVLPSTREQMIQSFKDRAAASKPNEVYPIVGAPGAVSAARTASAKQVAEAEAFSLKKAYQVFKAAIVDRSGNVRSALLKQAGPEGVDAENKFMLSAGAPGRASQRFEKAYGEIYGGLVQGRIPMEDKKLVDEVIDSRRQAQIFSYRPDYTSPYGKSAADFEQNLRDIRARVGNAKFLELNARADVFFNTMKEQVGRLAQAGLLTEEEAAKLSRFEYSPREYIDILDPAEVHRFGKSTMSVRSSGIQSLSKGSDLPLEMNSDTLLAQTISRVEGRIMRNEANKALAKVADRPNNGIVSRTRDKALGADPTQVSYMEGGQKQTIFMNKDMAKEWLNYRPEWADTVGKSLGKWTGANLLRTFATGINPVAGPFLFLMDAQSAIWLSHLYSGFVPKAVAQLGADLWSVVPDAITRGPKYQEYMAEGGAMPFLVHGARGTGLTSGPFVERNWNALSTGLKYANETWEIAMRLAIRERAKKQGLTSEQATGEARRWIDFSQGGHIAKFADNVVPYLNAGIQGMRQLPREISKSPGKAVARASQFAAGVSALYLYNWMRYPYVMQQVPDDEQARYFIFPTDQYAMDASGQKRFIYYKVPITQNLRWLKGTIDAGLDMAFRGKPRTREFWQSMKDSFSVLGDPTQLAVPVVKAAQEYASNYDFYNQDNIWKGADNIPPSAEFLALPDTPTSDLAIDIGRATGLSPTRLTKAFHDVVPRGLYTDAVDWAYRYAKTGDALPPDAGQVDGPNADVYIARQYPFLSRLIGVTHPMANLYDQVQATAEPIQGADYALTRQLDTLSMGYLQAEGVSKRTAMEQVQQLIANAPDSQRQRLAARFKNTVVVDEAYQRYTVSDDMPPKNFWLTLSNMPADARAAVFYEQWNGREGGSKRSMIALAKRMPGFWSPDFNILFNRIRAERGTSPEE